MVLIFYSSCIVYLAYQPGGFSVVFFSFLVFLLCLIALGTKWRSGNDDTLPYAQFTPTLLSAGGFQHLVIYIKYFCDWSIAHIDCLIRKNFVELRKRFLKMIADCH